MIIQLYPLDYTQWTASQQLEKVLEEIGELEHAGDRLDCVAKEAFDVIQALIGYLITLGIDLAAANNRHIDKLTSRERQKAGAAP